MCLIAFAIGVRAHCPLLIASNRDEFFDRPTQALHRWTLPNGSGVLAGRDQRDGGTWLGFSETGRVAMLTNVRSAGAGTGARSRGELPTRWLAGDIDLAGLSAGIDPAAYGGFNLVVGDVRSGTWAWLSNRDPADPHWENEDGSHARTLHQRTLAPGVYGLSNAALNTPWPKTERLKTAMTAALDLPANAAETLEPEALAYLASALAHREPAPDHLQAHTGMPANVESALSSAFVHLPGRSYGTRSSLVVSARPVNHPMMQGWHLQLTEWSHAPGHHGKGHDWRDLGRVQHDLDWIF